jgi:hypothetical protein
MTVMTVAMIAEVVVTEEVAVTVVVATVVVVNVSKQTNSRSFAPLAKYSRNSR